MIHVSGNRAIYIRSDNDFTVRESNVSAEEMFGPLDRKLIAVLDISPSQPDIPFLLAFY